VEKDEQSFYISSTAGGLLLEILDAGVEERSWGLAFGHVSVRDNARIQKVADY
jgi:hypothetical protein